MSADEILELMGADDDEDDEEEDDMEEDEEEDETEKAILKTAEFSDDEDEEEQADEKEETDAFAAQESTIAISKSNKKLTKGIAAAKAKTANADANGEEEEEEGCGVVYLGRIPHGFYEEQMKEYFSQFGEVTRLKLSRNKKVNHSIFYNML